ncbi:hypothetical protein CP985_03355 [Malaciobacter mytili LMG 24559]|uniref:F-type type IV conjugative transfer system protein TraU n=1 Tax=Malaciobacter mytili LMG 24559 TaxID=1032238 RepID=A0AAX2AJS2_9BACT|nr:TraU family protein [Malaciobacter mytili]AXH16395.1 F-type type IV conjugative transfer system protein TraU [Malaciobacter mytili LMG 24559]RXK16461.1 hypothetical protein CP985_03355 [Malaciobacter mytili LMG 24559]
MIKYIIFLGVLINSVYAEAPILKFMSNIDWHFMGDKTSFSIDLCSCTNDADIKSAGLKATIAEPVAMLEFTNTPWNIVAIGKKFDKSITRKQGTSRADNGYRRYGHFIAFAPLGLLNFVQDAVCFERMSSFSFLYWSEVIPSQTNDVMALFTQGSKGPFSKIWYNNPIAALACSADCIATYFNKNINSLHWCAGCAGSTGNNTAYGGGKVEEPILASHAQALGMVDDLHYGGLLALTSKAPFQFSPVEKIPNATCGAKYFPIAVKSANAYNLAYPTVWDATVTGKVAFMWTNFKNKPTSEDDTASWLWVIKDTCIGAAKCKSMFTKKVN